MLNLSISFIGNNTGKYKKYLKMAYFKKLLLNANKECNKYFNEKGLITLVFVDDLFIKKLNKKWRNLDKPTDVLSFSNISEDNFPSPKNSELKILGEIFISLDAAKLQAKEYNYTLQEEVNKLLVHGVLHIFGYDHESEKDYFEMNSLEEKIINAPI